MKSISSISFSDTKNHYEILDGLRGIAAIIVVIFHLFETFSGGTNLNQIVNHGYLAVDFFFVLSGFVVGFAYDDRWEKMTLKNFFKRRLIRLHPMIIIAMVIGLVSFILQQYVFFPGDQFVSLWKLALVFLVGLTLLPLPPSMDVRGWMEMHPLNGPAWTLFFEYIANILYALFIRKFSNKLLAFFVIIFGVILLHLAITKGDVIGGWSLKPAHLRIGLTRLLFPFFAGLLLSRISKPGKIKNAFLWCTLLLVTVLVFPRIGGAEHIWMNGIYVAVSILIIFPLIVFLGASGEIKNKKLMAVNRFLGDISYPLYIIHYPFIYLFVAWAWKNQIAGMQQALPFAAGILVVVIVLSWVIVKLYDVPVRKWLAAKFLK